ncbi:MAG: hypothetical protein JXA25_11915 [Anaerolineales bacterium]|nr:hypothetical protein [Anaerolineales bacterium]
MATVHIVSHTHWDREWYKPFQVFRVKLIYVLDTLMDILEQDPDYRTFMLDGQTSVLEDYLQVRPDQEGRLRQLISSGRIQVGPWYIQPDEFAPDGESLIRNLLIGMDIAEQYGESMKIGYLPDSFGHSGQMPHILQGFGIDSAVVMRGVPADQISTSEFIWQGLNNDRVLTHYLHQGYSNAMVLPENIGKARVRLSLVMRGLRKRSTSGSVLLMNGIDHQFPQAFIPDLIKNLNKRSRKTSYMHSTLEAYLGAVQLANPELPTLNGELLAPVKHRVHSSIASTRIYQKQKNRHMQALLEKYTEPAAVLGWVFNAGYPSDLLNHAWKVLLQNQTHDGIGGCCTDEVHREMDGRFEDIRNMGETLCNTYTRAIARRIATDRLALVVFNSAGTQGRQLVRATVYTKKKDFLLQDADGNRILYDVDCVEKVDLSQKSIWTLYINVLEEAYKADISFYADFGFNAGYRVFELIEGKSNHVPPGTIFVEKNTLENDFFHIGIQPNGTLTLLDKATGRAYENLHLFEDCGDAGDTYNYSPVLNDTVITSEGCEAEVTVLNHSPIKAAIEIRLQLQIPGQLVNEDRQRSAKTIKLPITSRITIYSDIRRIDFETTVENTALDHRLRMLFPTGLESGYSFAETQFGTVRRATRLDNANWKKKKWHEKPLPIYSQQKFVDVNDGSHGLSILNRGLPEYEIYTENGCTIAITLLRCVGMMGKGDLLIRPGRPSGMTFPTPDAQCPGTHTFEYAIFPHAGGVDEGNVPGRAAEFNAPPQAVQNCLPYRNLRKKRGFLLDFVSMETLTSHVSDQLQPLEKADFSLLTIDGESLQMSALKKAEKEDALIVRLYNSSASPVSEGRIQLGIPVLRACLTNFREVEQGSLELMQDGCYVLPEVRPFSAVTLKFELMRDH